MNSATMTGKGRKTTTKIRPLRLCRRRRSKLPSKKQCTYSYRIYSSFTRVLFSFSFSSALRVNKRHATATRARLNFHPQNRERKQNKQTKTNFLKTISLKNGDACLVFAFASTSRRSLFNLFFLLQQLQFEQTQL